MSTHATSLDVAGVRAGFPSIRDGRIYLDNPGGTQVHGSVMTAVTEYYLHANATLGGPFETSIASEAMLQGARRDLARFLGCDAGEVIFGANMTTLTFHAARALTRGLGAGDEILVTRADHDGNVAPWVLAAEDRGAAVRFVDADLETCLIDVDDFAAKLSDRTRVAAFNWATNGAGTVNDVARLAELARSAGALSYVDAVQ